MGYYIPHNRLREARFDKDVALPDQQQNPVKRLTRIAWLQAELTNACGEKGEGLGYLTAAGLVALGVTFSAGAVLMEKLLVVLTGAMDLPAGSGEVWLAAAAFALGGLASYGLLVACLAPSRQKVCRQCELRGELTRLESSLRESPKN